MFRVYILGLHFGFVFGVCLFGLYFGFIFWVCILGFCVCILVDISGLYLGWAKAWSLQLAGAGPDPPQAAHPLFPLMTKHTRTSKLEIQKCINIKIQLEN